MANSGQDIERRYAQASGEARPAAERWYSPRSDILETEKSVVVLMDLPGVEEKNLSIDVDKGVLTVTGKTSIEQCAQHECVVQEYGIGSWRRSFALPSEIDPDNIEAALRNGVLRLELKRSPKALPRKIQVKVV